MKTYAVTVSLNWPANSTYKIPHFECSYTMEAANAEAALFTVARWKWAGVPYATIRVFNGGQLRAMREITCAEALFEYHSELLVDPAARRRHQWSYLAKNAAAAVRSRM